MPENVDTVFEIFDSKGDWTKFNRDDLKNKLIESIDANFDIKPGSHNSLK